MKRLFHTTLVLTALLALNACSTAGKKFIADKCEKTNTAELSLCEKY